MSSAQAISVNHNLLQLLSTEAAAFSGLSQGSPAQGGLFSEALINSMREQGMLSSGAVGAEPGGMDLPVIGEDLPSGGQSLVAVLQQSLNGGRLDLQGLEAAGLDADAVESGALEVVQLLAAVGRGDESALDNLDQAFKQLQELMVPPVSVQAENDVEVEVRSKLAQGDATDQLFSKQYEPVAVDNEHAVGSETKPQPPVVDLAARRPQPQPVITAEQENVQPAPAEVLRSQLGAGTDVDRPIPSDQRGEASTATAGGAEHSAPSAAISAGPDSGDREVVSQPAPAGLGVAAAAEGGRSENFVEREPASNSAVIGAEVSSLAQTVPISPPVQGVETVAAEPVVLAAPPSVAVATEQMSVRNAAVQGDVVRADVTPAQPPQQSVSSAESQVSRVAVPDDKASLGAAAARDQGGSSAGNQRGEGEASRQDSFRDNMAAIRAELAAAGAGSDDSVEKSTSGGQGFASIAGGRGVAEDGVARNIPAVSNFQQLQSAYKGDAVGEVSLNLPERFGSEKWTPGLSQRVVWMSNQQVGFAELRLDPPDLGSLNIRLSIQNDQASLSFTSPHAHVREILEQQMPRLREMLAENGIELQHSDVSDQSSSQQSNKDDNAASRSAVGSEMADDSFEEAGGLGASLSGSVSMVDYYA
ncbi:MAG: flagellar hook-length control protein FliK [Motiliproteus sp.]